MQWIPIHEWFSQVSHMRPDKIAIEWGSTRVTYRELEEIACQFAGIMAEHRGWKKETVISIMTESPVHLICSILGTLKAGGAFSAIDPLTPTSRIATMLEIASPGIILVDRKYEFQFAELSTQVPSKPDVLCIADLMRRKIARMEERDESYASCNPDALCYLYFTSGSTGEPKAIAGRLKAVDHFVRWEVDTFQVGPDSRISQLANVAFDAYLKDVFVALCSGGTLCVPKERDLLWQPSEFANWVNLSRVSHLHCTPSMFRSLLNAQLTADCFETLRFVLLAGEPVLPADVDRWMSIFGDRIPLVNLYGPSETTLVKLFHIVTEEDRRARNVPIGQPMEGCAALIADSAGNPCGPGVMGEIWIRTPFRSLGYHRRPDLTNEVFVANPFTNDSSDIIYKTGDQGRIRDSGDFEFAGRSDGQVKIRGARIELNEVESTLIRSEAVSSAVVVAQGDLGSQFLCAYVVLGNGRRLADVIRHMTDWLPPFMIPSEFVVVDSLPKTSTGKIDRKQLVENYRPLIAAACHEDELTPLQRKVADIWIEVLKVPRVGLEDNFFRLGGHSLTIVQIVSRVRREFDVELSIADMFVGPTLRAFSETIEDTIESQRAMTEAEDTVA